MRSAAAQGPAPDRRRTLLGHAVPPSPALLPRAPRRGRRARARAGVRRGRRRSASSWAARGHRASRSSSWAPATRCAAGSTRCRPASPAPCSSPTATCRCSTPTRSPTLLAEHAAAGAAVTLLTAELADPTGYGRVVREPDGAVTRHRRAGATPRRSSGRSARSTAACTRSTPRSSPRAWRPLGAHNSQGELYLTDLVAAAVARGSRCAA